MSVSAQTSTPSRQPGINVRCQDRGIATWRRNRQSVLAERTHGGTESDPGEGSEQTGGDVRGDGDADSLGSRGRGHGEQDRPEREGVKLSRFP